MNHEYAQSTEYDPIYKKDYGNYIVNYTYNQKVNKYIGWVKIGDDYIFATSQKLAKMYECIKIKVGQKKGPGYASKMSLCIMTSSPQDIPYRAMSRNQRKFAFTAIDNKPKGKKMKKKAKLISKDTDAKASTPKSYYKYEEVDGKLIVYKIEKVAEYKIK
jgi:hypothetical protein